MGAADLFTLQDIAEEVAYNHGSQDAITIAHAKKWINRALIKMSAVGEWPFLNDFGQLTIVTDENNNEYTLGGCVRKIRSLYMREPERKLILIDDRKFRYAVPDETASSGSPTHYRMLGYDKSSRGPLVSLWPFPDGDYTVYVDAIKQIPLLEQDQDDIREISGVPEHLLPLVVDLATAISFRGIDDAQYDGAMGEAMQNIMSAFYEETMELDQDIQLRPMEGSDVNRLLDPILPPEFGE